MHTTIFHIVIKNFEFLCLYRQSSQIFLNVKRLHICEQPKRLKFTLCTRIVLEWSHGTTHRSHSIVVVCLSMYCGDRSLVIVFAQLTKFETPLIIAFCLRFHVSATYLYTHVVISVRDKHLLHSYRLAWTKVFFFFYCCCSMTSVSYTQYWSGCTETVIELCTIWKAIKYS